MRPITSATMRVQMPCEYMVVMPDWPPANSPLVCCDPATYLTPFSMTEAYLPSPGTWPAERKAMTHSPVMAGSRAPPWLNPPPPNCRPDVHDPSGFCDLAR